MQLYTTMDSFFYYTTKDSLVGKCNLFNFGLDIFTCHQFYSSIPQGIEGKVFSERVSMTLCVWAQLGGFTIRYQLTTQEHLGLYLIAYCQ